MEDSSGKKQLGNKNTMWIVVFEHYNQLRDAFGAARLAKSPVTPPGPHTVKLHVQEVHRKIRFGI